MTLQSVGTTTHFQVQYDDSLFLNATPPLTPAQQAQVKANLIANANFLLGVVEGAFTTTTGVPSRLAAGSERPPKPLRTWKTPASAHSRPSTFSDLRDISSTARPFSIS